MESSLFSSKLLLFIWILFTILERSFSLQTIMMTNNIYHKTWQRYIGNKCRFATRLSNSVSCSSNPNDQTAIIPRAAVSVVVMHSKGNENKYVLVQRGKEPNKVRKIIFLSLLYIPKNKQLNVHFYTFLWNR